MAKIVAISELAQARRRVRLSAPLPARALPASAACRRPFLHRGALALAVQFDPQAPAAALAPFRREPPDGPLAAAGTGAQVLDLAAWRAARPR